ncbi:hypothetical protein [Candidatus Amarobacter glycogenicus]|uniref:AMIN-like domain-containing (lipo)protein n=1 Tax=Candidatus Amarobacter glycogenicus TaxID=3140699 RepID=UPI002A15B31C|nr:hypothetical protein [Dehalococcoidia bacterium]
MRIKNLVPLAAFVPALLLSACGDDDDNTASATATAPAATPRLPRPLPRPSPHLLAPCASPPTASGAFQGSTTAVEVAPPAGLSKPPSSKFGPRHEGYDRLVFEFAGAQLPGYRGELRNESGDRGSGQDVTAFVGEGTVPAGLLLITMRPASAHNEAGQLTAVRTLRPALSSLKNVFGTCDFEGVVTYAVAVSGMKPFTVSTPANPPRLVIDFAR